MRLLLFRGGMCGDMISTLLDRSIIDLNQKDHLKLSRTKLKKFWKYTDEEKKSYIQLNLNSEKILLSHDTDLSYIYPNLTTQLICSDESKIMLFAERFESLHKDHVIKEAKKFLNNKEIFVEEYAKSLIDWQNYHQFNRFDIKNIGSDQFLYDLQSYFNIEIDNYIVDTYQSWQKKNKEFV